MADEYSLWNRFSSTISVGMKNIPTSWCCHYHASP
jgi:hypothetical protein